MKLIQTSLKFLRTDSSESILDQLVLDTVNRRPSLRKAYKVFGRLR